MAAWQSEPGATLLVPSGPGGLHLFIVVLGPVVLPAYGPSPQTAMVSITSIRSGVPHDAACEVNAGARTSRLMPREFRVLFAER